MLTAIMMLKLFLVKKFPMSSKTMPQYLKRKFYFQILLFLGGITNPDYLIKNSGILPRFFILGSLGVSPVVSADPVRFPYSCYLEHPAFDTSIIGNYSQVIIQAQSGYIYLGLTFLLRIRDFMLNKQIYRNFIKHSFDF